MNPLEGRAALCRNFLILLWVSVSFRNKRGSFSIFSFLIFLFSTTISYAQPILSGSQNIVCQNQVSNYSLTNSFNTYLWTVTGGTPSSSTSSSINVTWGTGNRGQVTVEGFNGGISQGTATRRIYIDQPSVYIKSADTTICNGGSATIGLSFANKSLKLNGTTDYVGIANSNLINLGVTDYRTVSLWFKANDVTTRQVLYNEGGASNGFSMYIEGGKVYVLAWENNSAWNAPNATINAGQWYNITFVFDQDSTDGYHFKGYLDGVNIGQFNEGSKADNGLNAHSGPVAIGSNSNIRFHDNSTSANNYFNGYLDGFKLWNRSLTAAEIIIEKNHWLTSPVIDAALDVYINFDNSVLDIADNPSAEDGAIYGSPVYDDDAPLVPNILWSPGGSTNKTITVSPTVTTAYCFTLTEKLSNICNRLDSIKVWLPKIISTTPGLRCGPGIVQLGATASVGTINWYAASTGGASLGTGTSFTTPSISATTSYWVDATSNGCTSGPRTEVIATISTINGSQNIVCPNEIVNYSLSNSFTTYLWTVTGGTPSSSTSSSINVTWGTGNRGQITVEGFIGGISQGTATRRIYIDQKSVYTKSADTTICNGGSATIGLSFTNKSLKLNGTTDYVGIANSNLINLNVTDYRTVSLWFKANDVTTRQVLYNEGGPVNGFSMYIEGGKVYVLAWESSTAWNAPNTTISTGQWYNISFVFDQDASDGYHFKGYLNGVSIGQFNEGSKANDGMAIHSGPVAIGSNSNIRFHENSTSANNYFNGYLDGFKLWNRSLSAAEIIIEKNHWLTSPVIDAALDVYINFDNSVLDIADNPSAEDGALYGSPVYDDDAPLVPNIVWTPGGSTNKTITISPTVTTAYRFTLTEKLSNFCNQVDSINVFLPTIIATTPGSRCGPGTVQLGAIASIGTINWYAAATGGSSLGTGITFTTPSLSSNTTYWIDATNNGCTTPSRTAITATIGIANPVEVVASSGTYQTCYPALKDAFDAINNGTHQGVITINIVGNTTETVPAVLNASGSGAALYSIITIKPSGSAARTISGNLNAPLIDLNGADNVTINGLNTGGNSLTISNASNSAVAGTSAIRWIADAINNIITNCTIESSGTGAATGTIFLSTGDLIGNNDNTISNNIIQPAGSNLPTNAIYSAGTSVVVDNRNITVTNNNIFDYFNPAVSSNGIYVASNSSLWTISGNKLFQTSSRTTTTASLTHRAINVITASGAGYTINNNIIGFANASGTGTTSYLGLSTLFRAIEITTSSASVSSIQGNTISGISFSTTSGLVSAPGIFTGISILGGDVNVGTVTGNSIGASTGTGSISVISTTSLGFMAGIYSLSSGVINIQNNNTGSISTGGIATMGYAFHGIYLAGAANYTIAANTVGSITTANSITIGIDAFTTSPICTFSGITNVSTGTPTIIDNIIQNCSVYGTGASVFYGIYNTGGSGILNINNNSIRLGTNEGTGALTAILNTATIPTVNINNNIIRSFNRTLATGAFTGISSTGAVTIALNINNNQFGNVNGGLITYDIANSSALNGITVSGATGSCALTIQGNDFRGIEYTVTGSGINTYISNTAATLSQNISDNTFTDLSVNTTGNISFMSLTTPLSVTGVQTVSNNKIIGTFSKTASPGTVTFCTSSGTSANGSVITHDQNDFSNVSVTGTTIISGWINSNTSLNKTFSNNIFGNWTGGSAAVTAMTITGGSSTITGNTINNITTGTFATAPIVAISSSATESINITNNTISGLVTGTAAFINSFTGISNTAGNNITITGNTITGCTAGGTVAAIFTGITTSTAGSGILTNTGNSIISGTNAGTGAFTAINNSVAFATVNINSNIIRNNTIATGTFTAIANSGAVMNAININNNQLGNTSGGLVTCPVTTAATLVGINNTGGVASCALSIQNNDIRGITYITVGSNTNIYISNSAATLSQNISNNTFTNLSVNTTGAITFISNSVIMPENGTQNINGNSISGTFTRVASSGVLTLFTSVASTTFTGVVVNNNNNNFSNINLNGTATISGWINTDAGLGNVTKTIDENIFSNWSAGTGTITALAVNITSPNNETKNNSINNITSAGTIYGITSGAGNDNILSNTIDTLVSTGGAATIVNGIALTAGGTLKTVYNNNIYYLQANNITTGSVSGVAISGGVVNSVVRNKIYGISSNSNSGITTGTVNGILVSGAIADQVNNIRNNLIGDLQASSANVAEPIRGISIINTGLRAISNVYYNTVYINASSSGATFGSSGIYHTASATFNTGALDLRNNIIVNISTPNGSGLTVTLRRSAGTAGLLANYANTSNNNLFYAGTPGSNSLIFSNTTNTAQTLDAYKSGIFTAGTISPRDLASVTENPTFISTDGASADFLHINTSVSTQIESGAVNIPGVTLDYDDIIRQGNAGYTGASTSAPDIGANEGDFNKNDITGPAIFYSTFANNSCLSNPVLSAIIVDGSNVDTTSGTRPRIYYKRSTDGNTFNDNTSGTAGWKFVEASNTSSPFSLTMNFALLSGGTGVAAGQIIQYFVVAQDQVATPNISINSGLFNTAPASVALTAAAFPITGTINIYTILAGLSGTVTVGSGGTYTTLTGAGGLFAALNTNGLTGNLIANITSTSITETGANSLNAISYGCSANYTIIIKPNSGVAASLTGSVAAPLINLNGADYVTIDGLNTGGSSLTISNSSISATASTSTIRYIADAINNTITNCTIEGSGTGAATGTILLSTGTLTGNDDNVISNNIIQPAGSHLPTNAIYSAGTSVVVDNRNITVTNNNIFDYFNPAVSSNGIYVASNSSFWTISGNKFYQTSARSSTAAALTHRAINIVTAGGSGYTINNNIIGFANAGSTGTTTYLGQSTLFRAIELTANSSSVSSIQGNTISGISFSTTSGLVTAPGIFTGISVLAGDVNIGTITGNIIGASTGIGSVSISSATSLGYISGIYSTSTGNVNIQNNSIGSISAAGATTIGFTFHGINTAGTATYNIAANTVGSLTTVNAVSIGDGSTTTPICTFSGITNAATGTISLNNNIIQNCSVYGTGASVFYGINNSGGSGILNINNNSIRLGTNEGTGVLTAILNTATIPTVNINSNIIRSFSRTLASGAFTGISSTGAVAIALNINNNQFGNVNGGLITYDIANSSALNGISVSGATGSCALTIQGNDFRGIEYTVTGSGVNTYISNTAATLSQNISNNTFTNLSVNTTGNITFMTLTTPLSATGVQTVNSNRIIGTFSKTASPGTVTFCTSSGTSANGSVITHDQNDFSNVSVTGTTIISGWINSNTSLNKTFSNNIFNNWTGGSAAVTAMTITGGSSTITGNTISNITTGTSANAPIVAISSSATESINITNNTISGLVTGTAAFVNSFTGISNTAGNNVTITGNTITGCTAGGTVAAIFTGITTITAGSGILTNTGNSIISGTNAGTGAFTAINNSVAFATVNINSNIIRSNTVATGTFTAIANSGGILNTININNNQLGNATGGLVTYPASSSSALIGISNTGGAISSALSIQDNDIRGIVHSIAGSSAHTYITNSATTFSQNISNNTFTNLDVNTTGSVTFISCSVVIQANGSQTVSNNSIITGFNKGGTGGIVTLFTSTALTIATGITVIHNNNNFSNITVTGTTTIAGWVHTDAGVSLKTFSNNTFNNWISSGTGAITQAMSINGGVSGSSIYNNTINSLTGSGAITGIISGILGTYNIYGNTISYLSGGGIVMGYSIPSIATSISFYQNTIQSLSTTGGTTTTVSGISAVGGAAVLNIYQNTIINLQANSITTGSVRGIIISGGYAVNVYQNTISGLIANAVTTVATGSVNGIMITGGSLVTINRNKIYDLSSASAVLTGTVNGIIVSGAIASLITTIRNNYIGDIRVTAASNTDLIRGIAIVNTGAFTSSKVYYNTIFINASSTGVNFGTAGIYHTANTTATIAALDLRNNIIINTSVASGSGLTIAYRRSTGGANTLNNFVLTSNNNLFFAGTPDANNLIYYDGVSSAQTIEDYIAGSFTAGTIAPRDANSVSEDMITDINFLSVTGSDANYLHINIAKPNRAESNAENIPGITIDFDGEIRQGNSGYAGTGTKPDIGADEFNGIRTDLIWTGAVSTDWNNVANWRSSIPFAETNVIIPTGLSRYPILNTGSVGIIKSITIQTGGSVIIVGNTLQIFGTLSNSGSFTASNGTIEWKGTNTQIIAANTFTGNLLKNVIINNSANVTLAGVLKISGTLSINNGSLNTGGFLTLTSTDTTTASVAQITSGASTPVNGNVTVERYIKGRRKYRIMTSSVTTSPAAFLTGGQEALSIWGNWQNQGNNSTPNVGTYITGGTVGDGFDQQTTNASMFTYNTATRSFEGFTTANGKNTKYTPLKAGVPYFTFVFGDRTNSAIASSPNRTTFIATGTLLTGNQTYNSGSAIPLSNVTNGYTMIGNPFASPIDWATLSRTNLADTYWGWDPNLSSTGGYVTVNTSGSVTLIAPFSGTVGLDQYIQSGQGFFVKTTASSPVLIIKESDKVSNFNGNAFRTTTNSVPLIAINLMYDDATGRTLMDGVLAAFDTTYSNQIGKEDATKIYKAGEALSIESQYQLLSINGRRLPSQGDTLLLNIAGLSKPQYKFQIFMKYLENTALEPYLKDTYLNTSRLLSLTDTNYINFSINTSIPASISANRFYIVFRQSGTLSGVITTINAKKINRQVQVDWGVSSEAGIQKYEIQRENNGNGFVYIGELPARGINGQQYQWIDINPNVGINQYRIKVINADGTSSLSRVVAVNITEEKPEMKLYPNPVRNHEAKILFTNLKAGKYDLKLFNLKGQMVMNQMVEYNGSASNQIVSFSRLIIPGMYILQLNDDKIKINQKIIIE